MVEVEQLLPSFVPNCCLLPTRLFKPELELVPEVEPMMELMMEPV